MSGVSQPISAPAELAAEWVLRLAVEADAAAVAGAVRQLLLELGADAAPLERMAAAARALIVNPEAGAVVVAEADDRIVGVLAASLQDAIHVPGRYAIVQDLWVDPAWRGRLLGAGLIDAFADIARGRGAKVAEVGLPKARFRGLEATESFYLSNGFTRVGTRMRRGLV